MNFYPLPIGWLLEVFGFDVTLIAMVISWRSMSPGFLTPLLTQLSFQSHRLLSSHALPQVRGENTLDRKFHSTGPLTHNHQAMTPTRSPLSHPGGANPLPNKPLSLRVCCTRLLKTLWEMEKLFMAANFSFSHSIFYLFG